jgi:UDP-glucose 4-epimerase
LNIQPYNDWIIGIDLDNTIISYDESIYESALSLGFIASHNQKNKKHIRDSIRLLPDGDLKWQKVQALAYGKNMGNAKIIDGALSFFSFCKQNNIQTYIVSHKTEFSNVDREKINLHASALAFLEQNDFFIHTGLTKEHIFFLPTREEKIKKIKNLECTHFIDDLEEIFEDPDFPKEIKQFLYAKSTQLQTVILCQTWPLISQNLFQDEFMQFIFSKLLHEQVHALDKVGKGKNSRVYKLRTDNGIYLGKQYFRTAEKTSERLEKEFSGLQYLAQNNIQTVPKPFYKDEIDDCAVYEYIEGDEIESVSEKDIEQLKQFVQEMIALTAKKPLFPSAAGSCFCLHDIEKVILQRLDRLLSVKNASNKHTQLHAFLHQTFIPHYQEIINWTKKKAKENNISYTEPLADEYRILSPSDLGFHNAIRKNDGTIIFLDFEYFGYDDPMKLIADLLLHPAMDLTEEQKQEIVFKLMPLFNKDPMLKNRLPLAYNLFSLVWCLIFLNEFLETDYQRRVFASAHDKTYDEILAMQLDKSKKLFSKLYKTYMQFPYLLIKEEPSMKKAIVTGGAGFIGSHMVELLLQKGFTVVAIDDFSNGNIENVEIFKDDPQYHFLKMDLAEPFDDSCFENADYIFHMAALADIVPSIENPGKYHASNVTGTLRVLEAARKYGVKKLIYSASSSCYGIPDSYPTSETAALRPEYPYALTKMLGEEYALFWHKLYGLPVIALRYFNVYGTRARNNSTYGAVFKVFLKQKLEKKPLTIVGDGSQKRDFTYVTDIAKANLLAAESSIVGEIFNVGTGNPVSVNRLAELIGGERVFLPKRPGEPDETHADISKIQKALHWKPEVDFETGVQIMLDNIDYWKEAPLWTPESIDVATKSWFKYLGKK